MFLDNIVVEEGGLILAEIHILLPKEVAPRIINRPILPADVAIGAPPTIHPDAIDEETRMKEAAMKASKAGMEADEARAKASVKTAAKAGVEAPKPLP